MSTPRRTTREATKLATRPRLETSVVVDLDHTIADAYWRDPLLGQWEEYYSSSIDDKPFPFVYDLLMLLHYTGLYNLVCVTARPEKWRTLSMKWMIREHIPMDELLMRPDGDHRPSREVKAAIIRERFPDLSQIAFALEDVADVCEAYRLMGINVLQVHKGAKTDADRQRPILPEVHFGTTEGGQKGGPERERRSKPRRGGPGGQHRLARLLHRQAPEGER